MANTTLTNLPTVTSLTGNEPLLGVQNGSSVQITTGQIARLSTSTNGYPIYSATQLANNPVTGTPSSSTYLRGDGTWVSVSGSGTVTSITAGTGLSGGTITGSGTISLANTSVTAASYGSSTSIPSFTVNAQGQLTLAAGNAVIAPANTLTGTVLASNIVSSSLTSVGTITSGVWNGTAITNTYLANSSLTVNGTSISLGGSGTVTAAAGTLTGTTLNSTVVSSSLTSVGTIGTGVWNGTAIGATYGGTGQTTYATGDLLYASATNTLSKLTAGTNGYVLTLAGGVPTWASTGSGSGTVNSGTAGQLTYYASTGTTVSGNANATIASGALTLGVPTSVAGSLGLSGVTSGKVTLQTASAAGTWSMTLPTTAGTNGYVLSTDGTGVTSWIATSGGGGTVTSVGLSFSAGAGNILSNTGTASPITGSGTYTLSVAGTSGGIPYFSSASAWSSSAALTANALMIGGGAGAAPATTSTGTGVLTALGNSVNTTNGLATGSVTTLSSLVSIGTISTGVWNGTAIGATYGGTGQTIYVIGDLLYASSTTALSKLADVATGSVLVSGGVGAAPAYSSTPSVSTITATASRTATSTTGAFAYGTNSFSDVNVLGSFQSSVNSYNQVTVQNTSAGTAASSEFIAYNDQGTAVNNFATVGINSSGYTGTGAINAAGYGYFLTGSTDLVIGTIGANAMHFVTNSAATDAMTISSSGVVSLGTALAVGSGGTAQSTYTTGDILYASATNTLSKLSIGSTNQVLTVVAGVPAWAASAGSGTVNTGTANQLAYYATSTNAVSGLTLGTGVLTALGQNVTGSGSIVLATSPSLTTPTLGVASATTVNKVTLTAPATGSTLTIADGKTLTVSNTLTLAGTDSTVMTFPSSSTTVAGLGTTQTFTATNTFSQIIYANNAVTVTSNAGTVPITYRLNTFTNSSAATMAITMATASAVDGALSIVRIYDFSAAAQTIGWTNTENSTVSVPLTSNGSTTLPLTVGFQYNAQTSKWRCIASA